MLHSAAVPSFSSALAACGAFFIPKGFGTAIAETGGPELAHRLFVAWHLYSLALTWWYCARRGAEVPC